MRRAPLTAAHHKIPMLTVMWNNRAYHQEIMHLQRMANWRQRDVSCTYRLHDPRPFVNYAKLAEAWGMSASARSGSEGARAALKRGIEAVKMGEPVLIDVVTQPR
jgi:benzoylformate decarboxylase/acetolactate synthase-1/2/3 large subunit